MEAAQEVSAGQAERLAIPRRYSSGMKEIWGMQPRFENRTGKRPFRLLTHPRFRACYDFLELRAQHDEVPMELAHWWGDFQVADDITRNEMILQHTKQKILRSMQIKMRQWHSDEKSSAELPDNLKTDSAHSTNPVNSGLGRKRRRRKKSTIIHTTETIVKENEREVQPSNAMPIVADTETTTPVFLNI